MINSVNATKPMGFVMEKYSAVREARTEFLNHCL
jgi:hypothetical protein